MSLRVTCSSCGLTDDVPDEFAGKRLKCPQCRSPLVFASQKTSEEKTARPTKTSSPPSATPSRSSPERELAVDSGTPLISRRPSLLLVLAGAGVVLALLLVFGVTVALLIYAGRSSNDQGEVREAVAEAKQDRSQGAPGKPEARPNLLPAVGGAPRPPWRRSPKC